MKKSTVLRAAIAASGFLLFAVAGLAWACTAALQISEVTPQSGPAGTDVIVTGFAQDLTPVEIHWNDIAGPVLATGTPTRVDGSRSPYFSIPFTIPAGTPADVYYLVASQNDAKGNPGPRVTATVTVAPATGQSSSRSQAASGDLWSGLSAAHGLPSASLNSAETGNSLMGPGIAMVAVGLPALLGGLAAITAKRRRAGAARKSN